MRRSTPKERNLGDRLAELRKARGLSQKELAAQLQTRGCDLTAEMVWKIEHGRRNLSVYEIDKATEVLGVDYNALFSKNEQESAP